VGFNHTSDTGESNMGKQKALYFELFRVFEILIETDTMRRHFRLPSFRKEAEHEYTFDFGKYHAIISKKS
jgi:hypothetical protein